MQSGELVERTWWKEHLAAVVCLFAFWAGQHDNGVAAEVLVKAPGDAATSRLLIHGHRIVLVVEVGIELVVVSWRVGSGGVALTMLFG